jgi:TNF receptor-associated factor 4
MKFKSTFQDVTDKHVPVCPEKIVACPNKCGLTEIHRNLIEDHLLNTCPLTEINCTYHSVGCKVQLLRKDLPTHVADNLAVHMSLQQEAMSKELDQLKTRLAEQETKNSATVYKLEQSNAQIRMLEGEVVKFKMLKIEVERLKLEQLSFHSHLKVAPVNLFLAEFTPKRKNNQIWKSGPFYTHPQGYKICLKIYTNGNGDGLGTHVSVFVYLMRGEFDFNLKWPFEGGVFVRLLNQNDTKRYFQDVIRMNKTTLAQGSGAQVTDGSIAKSGFGLHKFISHAKIAPNYLKNDTLCFEVLSIV